MDKVDRILLDLGIRSDHIESSGRGFTFKRDEPLLMTFSKDSDEGLFTAIEILNEWDEGNIVEILNGYGEEEYAKKIAKAIVSERKVKPIRTTFHLVEVISSAVPYKYKNRKIHFATKTFQALRIAVNDEIAVLREGLRKSFERLSPNGRLVVISFHSLEDRAVKRFFKEKEEEGEGEMITKKPITPSAKEVAENPRSRSAKLRVIKKIIN